MRKQLAACLALISMSSLVSAIDVMVDANERLQKMEGFGASGAFGEPNLSNHNDFEEIVELAFNQLGLDIYRIQNRYNHLIRTSLVQLLGSKSFLKKQNISRVGILKY